MKQNYTLLLFSLILSILITEIILRNFPSLISRELLSYLPGTNVKKEILEKRGFKIQKNLSKTVNIEGYNFTYYLNNFPSIDDNVDIKLGATNTFYYKDGFCNEKVKYSDLKIIAVGDSFTYCTSVFPNQSWTKKVFKNIENDKKLNLGYPGSGPFEYNLILNKYITEKNILVLYGFYEGNDLRDLINFKYSKKGEKSKTNYLKKILLFFIDDFYTGNFLIALYKNILSFAKPNFRYSRTNFSQKFNINNTDIDELDKAKKLFLKENIDKEIIITKENYKMLLREAFVKANEIANSNNNEIIFLLLPAAYSSFGNNIKFEDEKIHRIIKNYSLTNNQLFKEICKEEKLNCLNLKDEFIKYNHINKLPSHFPSNVHLTNQGHEIVSNAVEKYICKNKKNLARRLESICF